MVKTAARLWGYAEDESESSFDPLVNILFSACALELEKISNEIHASRSRVLERMVQLLSPGVLCGPLPSHAIMHVRAIEKQAHLSETDQFYCAQKTLVAGDSTATAIKDIFFAPTGAFHVNAGAVGYLATGYQLFRYRDMTSKEVLTHCLPQKTLGESVLWIGITGHPTHSLHNTQCYFDIRNEVNKELFYQNLPQARWFYGAHELTAASGYNRDAVSGEHLNIEKLLTQKNATAGRTKELVNAFYKPRFITIKEPYKGATSERLDVPQELLQAFDKKDLEQLQPEKIRWIKVQFPENISNAVLHDVVCHVNCFPVINTRLHELTHHMREILNIVPLYTEDTFFDLQQITDHDGHMHNLRPVQKNVGEKLAVVLRQGGIGRFDEREAATLIEHIIQLLSDESAAFAILGREFLASEMRQLQQIIFKLEQQLHNRALHREHTPFLVVRQTGQKEVSNLFVTYWSTGAQQGNDIKAGTSLQVYKAGNLFQGDSILITTSIGGRNRLDDADSITAYKSALLSRDRLISLEDIRLFCLMQMGKKVKRIDVNKGVMVPKAVSQGFARTIDVTIHLNRKDYMDAQEKNQLHYWKENLALQLAQKSASLTPFRVYIEQES